MTLEARDLSIKSRRGGARPGAGRPHGSKNRTKAQLQQLGDGVHRLSWKQSTDKPPKKWGGRRPHAGRKPKYRPIIPPWRLPVCLSREELVQLLRTARASRERDWLMILVASWHGLSAAEVTGFTKDAVHDGSLTIQRVKSHKVTVQRLVWDEDPLLNERKPLIDFVEKARPDQPVFNISRTHFWRLLQKYALAAGIPQHKANPRTLKHSIAVQSLIPGDGDHRRDTKPKNKGRKPEEEQNKAYFKIGIRVEKEIPVHLKQDRHSIVEARRRVSSATRLEFDVVAQYHKRFRQSCAKTGIEMPA